MGMFGNTSKLAYSSMLLSLTKFSAMHKVFLSCYYF